LSLKKVPLKSFKGCLKGSSRERILDAIQLLSFNPYTELLQIKKMKGGDSLYRVRIQDYRIIYLIQNHMIKVTIIKVGHRKEVYE
jgi:mRNA interferase RelE/StbE